MNIFGRVFGGLLVLISLGWLATIVGIRPGWFGNNQINSAQPPATNSLTANPATGTTSGGKNQASSFDTKNTPVKAVPNSAGTTKAEVEKNPRSATPQPDKAVPQTAPAAPAPAAPQTAPAAAAPVSAGW